MINQTRLGLFLGSFISLIHLIWALIIAIMPNTMQMFLDWIFRLHFLKPIYIIENPNFLNGLLLVIITFVMGFVFGWICGQLRNMIMGTPAKKK